MPHALIIDDNQPNIKVLGTLLQNEGFSYDEVLQPADVENVIMESDPFDVIFLDLEFPTNNGFTILEKLHGMDKLAGIPIIAYSVHVSEIEVVRRAGFDGFLGKPLDADQFGEQLYRIMAGEAVWEAVS